MHGARLSELRSWARSCAERRLACAAEEEEGRCLSARRSRRVALAGRPPLAGGGRGSGRAGARLPSALVLALEVQLRERLLELRLQLVPLLDRHLELQRMRAQTGPERRE